MPARKVWGGPEGRHGRKGPKREVLGGLWRGPSLPPVPALPCPGLQGSGLLRTGVQICRRRELPCQTLPGPQTPGVQPRPLRSAAAHPWTSTANPPCPQSSPKQPWGAPHPTPGWPRPSPGGGAAGGALRGIPALAAAPLALQNPAERHSAAGAARGARGPTAELAAAMRAVHPLLLLSLLALGGRGECSGREQGRSGYRWRVDGEEWPQVVRMEGGGAGGAVAWEVWDPGPSSLGSALSCARAGRLRPPTRPDPAVRGRVLSSPAGSAPPPVKGALRIQGHTAGAPSCWATLRPCLSSLPTASVSPSVLQRW